MKKFLRKNWTILTVLGLALLTAWPLLRPGYFSHHDDLQVIRIVEMRKCFVDLQIPCRWVPDMGYGNGYPLFNYYSATPYYLGAILSYILGYIQAAKALFGIPIIVGGLSMYFLGKELFGRYGGLIASSLYIFVPYRALDTYVRGAVAENFALAISPLIFYFSLKLIQGKKFFDFLGLTLSLFILLTSHNIMTMLTIPIFLFWAGLLAISNKISSLKGVACSLVLALGLSAFFVFPAFLEKDLVTTQTLTQGHLDYKIHFVSLLQLVQRTWGYGSSVTGTEDGMSFQLGWPHLVMFAVVLILLVFQWTKLKDTKKYLLAFLSLLFAVSIFMTHGKSWLIWQNISLLAYVQFPWRFLGFAAFASSLLGGSLVYLLSGYIKWPKMDLIVALTIVVLTGALNIWYFQPGTVYPNLTDSQKLSGDLWEEQQKGAILDYLPQTAAEPKEFSPSLPLIREGRGVVTNFIKASDSWETVIDLAQDSTVEVPVFDFPVWQVRIGENIIPHRAGVIGRITFDLPQGTHTVYGSFKNTPTRTISNILTIGSFIFLLVVSFYAKARKILI